MRGEIALGIVIDRMERGQIVSSKILDAGERQCKIEDTLHADVGLMNTELSAEDTHAKCNHQLTESVVIDPSTTTSH